MVVGNCAKLEKGIKKLVLKYKSPLVNSVPLVQRPAVPGDGHPNHAFRGLHLI